MNKGSITSVGIVSVPSSNSERTDLWFEVWRPVVQARKSQIRKLSSFRYPKNANFLVLPVRNSQIRKFLWIIRKFLLNNALFCLKTVLKVVF